MRETPLLGWRASEWCGTQAHLASQDSLPNQRKGREDQFGINPMRLTLRGILVHSTHPGCHQANDPEGS